MSEPTKNLINVYVTPRSGRDLLCGIDADIKGQALLKVKVSAPPNDGKANAAVCILISKSIKIPKTKVKVEKGHKSRYKQLSIWCEKDKFTSWMRKQLMK